MWQAISRLLSEQLGEGEIELRNELPGGEVHAAWHLRYAGHDFFVKCDERELLPGFTAEADQLELLSRSKTVTVPKVWAVGADRDYSFLVMDYLPPRPLDAHSAFILGQQIARLHQWSDNHNLDSILITRSPQLHSPTPGNVAGQRFLLNNGLAGSWNWQQKKGSLSAISMPSSSIFSSVSPHINRSLLCCTAIYGPATVRWVRMARTFSTRPATGVTESATWRCYRCILNSRHKSMTAISQYPRYLPISLNVNRFTNSTRC